LIVCQEYLTDLARNGLLVEIKHSSLPEGTKHDSIPVARPDGSDIRPRVGRESRSDTAPEFDQPYIGIPVRRSLHRNTAEIEVSVSAVSLAPVAVRPDCQRKGIGSALIQEGLKRLRQDESIVIVLGHPDYYPRFGFSPALAKPISNPFKAPAAWMALELRHGALAGLQGCARYASAFGLPREWTFLIVRIRVSSDAPPVRSASSRAEAM
jgi:GNAT superfamily N-acetyltransferase